MKTHFPFAAAILALALAFPLQAEEVFFDSFESGDMSATNSDGFDWGKNNRTSVVTRDAAVYNNGEIYNEPPGDPDWEPKHGDHSLRFRYAAGQYMTEQRFDLGRHYNDTWFSYWIRVPVNFTHGSKNNKFLSVWPREYDKAGTVTWQTRPNGTGGANLVYQDGGVTSGEVGSTQFISVPDDRGRWMHVVARVKAASSANANDGIIQFYRRWEGEESYSKIHEKLNSDTWDDSSSEQGLSQGYILGWANDAYDTDTEWFVDQFAVHTASPFDDLTTESRPNPPVLTLD
jgi:hypothetical protein